MTFTGDTWCYFGAGKWWACDASLAARDAVRGLPVLLVDFDTLIRRHTTLPLVDETKEVADGD